MSLCCWRGTVRRLGAAGAAAAGAAVLLASPALAAGTGYGPSGPGPSTAPAGFTTVVTSQTVPATGGTVTATFPGGTITVSVPSGTFSTAVQVTVAQAPNEPQGAVVAFALTFTTDGQAVTGEFSPPVTFTIDDPAIEAGETVDIWNGASWVSYPDASVTDGTATITVTSDPTFAVELATSAPTTVVGATTVTTGVPVIGLGAIAAGMVTVGGGGLVVIRRRRRARI